MKSNRDAVQSGSSGYYAVPGQEDAGFMTDDTMAGFESSSASAGGDAYEYVACRPSAGQALTAIIGGAGIGALLMYLLDPKEGAERRHHLADMAAGAWDVMREKAGEYGHLAYDSAGRLKDRVAHSGYGEEAYDRARYMLRGRQSHGIDSGMGQLFAGLGVLAVGVSAMYYFDPQQGRARRAQCSQRTLSAFNRMFRSLEGLGRDAWNRAQGLMHDARSHTSREQVDDRVLCERVRSEIGRCVSNAGAIEIESRNGTVIVSGFVTPDEHDELLKCVWKTRGVQQLVNRLEVRQATPPSIPGSGGPASFGSAATSMTAATTSAANCPPGLGGAGFSNPT